MRGTQKKYTHKFFALHDEFGNDNNPDYEDSCPPHGCRVDLPSAKWHISETPAAPPSSSHLAINSVAPDSCSPGGHVGHAHDNNCINYDRSSPPRGCQVDLPSAQRLDSLPARSLHVAEAAAFPSVALGGSAGGHEGLANDKDKQDVDVSCPPHGCQVDLPSASSGSGQATGMHRGRVAHALRYDDMYLPCVYHTTKSSNLLKTSAPPSPNLLILNFKSSTEAQQVTKHVRGLFINHPVAMRVKLERSIRSMLQSKTSIDDVANMRGNPIYKHPFITAYHVCWSMFCAGAATSAVLCELL